MVGGGGGGDVEGHAKGNGALDELVEEDGGGGGVGEFWRGGDAGVVHDDGQRGVLHGQRDQSGDGLSVRNTKRKKRAHDTYLSGRPQMEGEAGGSGVGTWPSFSG